ncbi:MAG: outer membrane protein transport protein, partial [Alphaproteobacteria bacterium]
SMFWNPAAAAAAEGLNVSSNLSTVIANSEINASSGRFAPGGAFSALNGFSGESGDIGDPALIPASYANYQINDRLFLGLALNSQYGLSTKPDDTNWAGSPLAVKSRIFSLNVNPTLAYKVTPELTVGAGLQVQYFDVLLYNGSGTIFYPSYPSTATLPGRRVEADDVGFGATAGVTWKPAPGTQIGIGYRSAIKHDLEGKCSGASLTTLATGGFYCNTGGSPLAGAGAVSTDIILPEMVSFGLRQELSPVLALYGTVEWTNWSRIDHNVLITNQSGGSNDLLSITYEDGWFVSAGLEYKYSPSTTLRFGAGWEKSPITDEHRTVMLPDNDRYWLSAGASYKFSDKMTLDFAYSHLFVKDAPITTTSASLGNLLTAEGETNIDIVSVGFKYKMGGAKHELEPLK